MVSYCPFSTVPKDLTSKSEVRFELADVRSESRREADELAVRLQESSDEFAKHTARMEELTEVITTAVFHPERCHQFMFSSSCGKIQLGDLRVAATCDPHMTCLFEPDDASNNSFFSEIIASISDIKFSGWTR